MKTILKLFLAVLAPLGFASVVFGHAVSIGYENAGSPGAVNIWLGTYEHGGHHVEGGMNLVGVNGNTFASTTFAFNQLVSVRPTGLVDGTTNFFVQGAGGNTPLVGNPSSWLAVYPTLPVNHWQGVTFTGLDAGDYQFTWMPLGSPSAEWSPWSTSMNGIFTLGSSVVTGNGVPDGGSTVALLGLALLGVIGLRRHRK
jgi:hypothetical protein